MHVREIAPRKDHVAPQLLFQGDQQSASSEGERSQKLCTFKWYHCSQKERAKRTIGDIDNESFSESFVPFTRSGTVPLDKDRCFFCQLNNDEKLYAVRTENADRTLREAVETSNDPCLMKLWKHQMIPVS